MKANCADCGIPVEKPFTSQKDPEKVQCLECNKAEAMEIYSDFLLSKGKNPENSIFLRMYYKTKNQTKLF